MRAHLSLERGQVETFQELMDGLTPEALAALPTPLQQPTRRLAAYAAFERERYAEALSTLEMAKDAVGDEALEIAVDRAIVLARSGKEDAARRALARVLDAAPGHQRAQFVEAALRAR